MGSRRIVIAAALFFAFHATAAIEVGPPSTEVSGLGPCARSVTRCLAAAGPMVAWVETVDGEPRLRAAIGAARVELDHSRAIDYPAMATDGHSFAVIWQHDTVGTDRAISAAQLSGDGAVTATATFVTGDNTSDPPASVVSAGLEYAIALPDSIVYLRDGAVARETRLPGSTGAIAAANGGSILVVRRTAKWTSMLPYPFDQISRRLVPVLVATVIGSDAGPTRELMTLSDGHAASVAGGGDGYLLAWKEDGAVRAVRLDQSGGRVGSLEVVARYRTRGGVTGVMATRDGWLVAWDDRGSVFAAELDANGNRLGDVVTIAEDGRSPSIVKLGEGRFRVVYRGASTIESRVLSTGESSPPRRRAVQ